MKEEYRYTQKQIDAMEKRERLKARGKVRPKKGMGKRAMKKK